MTKGNSYQIMLGEKQKFTKQTKPDQFFEMKTDVSEEGKTSEERWGRRVE